VKLKACFEAGLSFSSWLSGSTAVALARSGSSYHQRRGDHQFLSTSVDLSSS
jgi:hypothetical protein